MHGFEGRVIVNAVLGLKACERDADWSLPWRRTCDLDRGLSCVSSGVAGQPDDGGHGDHAPQHAGRPGVHRKVSPLSASCVRLCLCHYIYVCLSLSQPLSPFLALLRAQNALFCQSSVRLLCTSVPVSLYIDVSLSLSPNLCRLSWASLGAQIYFRFVGPPIVCMSM